MFALQKTDAVQLILLGLDQNKAILQKQQEISELKKVSSQLRQTSYRGYLSTIGKEELLEEAKSYYLQSFSPEERESMKVSLEQMTLDSILPKLKEKDPTQSKSDYDFIEIHEIISQIEKD